MYDDWMEVCLKLHILSKCKEKCRRVVFSKLMYGLVLNTQEKISNCLINSEMLKNGLLF